MIVAGKLGDAWIYIVGPILGGLLAAFTAKYALRRCQMEQAGAEEAEARTGARRAA